LDFFHNCRNLESCRILSR